MPYAQQSHYTPSQPAPTRPLRGRVAHTTSPGPDADTFSWFDVQLLLAATNRLEPPAFEAWQQTATAGNPWRRLVEHLRQARPVPWQQLHHVLATLQQLASHTGQALTQSEAALLHRLHEAGACQPPGTLVHLPWAVTWFQQPSGYIPATATFLGETLASTAATLAQQWGALTHRNNDCNAAPTASHSQPPDPTSTKPHQASGSNRFFGHSTPAARRPGTLQQLFEQFFQRRFHRYNLQCNKYPPTRRTKPGTDNINTTQHEPAPSPPPAIPSPSGNPGRRGVDLQTALKINFTGFQSPPAFVKGRVRQALGLALETIQRADTQQQSVRAWKLWLLLPRMLLHRPPGVRTLPKTEWHTRITAFQAGDWLALLRAAQPNTCPPGKKRRRLTAETLRFILDDESITNTFVAVATRRPPRNQCSTEGRLVALSKPNGRVRGFVVGDLLRRVVARTLAQQHALTFQQACSPHQYALSTRAGSEAVVHAITSLTELDPTNTILSIDGVGAYDTIARSSMLQALAEVEGTNTCLAFVRQFYATTSTYIWHDHNGQPHEVSQAEGGEQGDPLMPALFSLGQRTALQTVHSNLEPGETLFAFLDDVYVVLLPHRVRPVYDLLQHHLFNQAHIQLNAGKTRVWNQAGQPPPNIQALGPDVWACSSDTLSQEQGLMVLGAPVGTASYKQQQLQRTREQHNSLLQRLSELEDLQAAWLLPLFCASPRCHYHLRMPLADAIPVLEQQAPEAFAQLLHQLQADDLQDYGWQPPEWQHLADGLAPPRHHNSLEDGIALGRGWQHKAATTTHTAFRAEVRQRLDPGSQALLESQTGPHASRAFTTIPYHNDNTYPSHLFRLLLLRRLRLPLPLFARFCRCRRTLDSLGDHRVACAQSGLLRARGGPLERAAARIWGGNQLAVDTTLLSPLTREGVPRQRGGTFAGTALGDARRRKEHTYPELLRSRRCKLVVLGLEVGGRWSEETASFIKLLAQHKARHAKPRHSSNTLYHNSINRQVVSTFDP